MNEQNLRKLTSSEAREIGKKGGKASGRVRREKRTMKQLLEIALSMMVTSKKGETASRKEVIAIQLVNKAASGDLKAIDLLTKLIGEQVVKQETEANVNIKKKSEFDSLDNSELKEKILNMMQGLKEP